MTEQGKSRNLLASILIGLLFLLPACGGSNGGGLFEGLGPTEFWAVDFGTNAYYQTGAREVGAGRFCRVYVETGLTVTQGAVDNIVTQFDNVIYPDVSAAFGDPPTPGVDGDPRITILIMNIRDSVGADGGVTTGYFNSINEFRQADIDAAGLSDKSNAREMIYLNASFPAPASLRFFRVVAHELQHMVHWEQKTHRLSTAGNSVFDDTWLNEAMSEAAPLFCGYGPDSSRIDTFSRTPSDSLTIWDGNLADYGAVYMWSQYLFDRYPVTFFRSVLADSAVGVASVSNVLATLSVPNTATTFGGLFFDWTMANLVALDPAVYGAPGLRPEWQYTTPVSLAAMFTASADRVNPAVTQPLRQWSADYYQFKRFVPPLSGTVSWIPASGQSSASFINAGDNVVTPDVIFPSFLSYTSTGYLVVRNDSGVDNTDSFPAPVLVTPSASPAAPAQAPSAAARPAALSASGEPQGKCGLDRFEQRERTLRARGLRVRF
jgi:hypothetical protein